MMKKLRTYMQAQQRRKKVKKQLHLPKAREMSARCPT